MAGLIARLFGGRDRPPDPNPLPGIGGYTLPPGPTGETGFPGSTTATRTFGRHASPRAAKLDKDQLGGLNQAMGSSPEIRQHSYRGDVPDAALESPRDTGLVVLMQTAVRQYLQHNHPTEFYGGVPLRTRPGSNTTGGNPLGPAQAAGGHSVRDTETPATGRQPTIGVGTPGAQNVRNGVALRHLVREGTPGVYRSAPNPAKPTTEVVVPNRTVFPAGGGNQTWSVEREMPYGGRGDGARGADLDGRRYYGTGQGNEFWNARQGDYGIARLRGGKRPVGFTEPAPWTGQFYDTTDSVGSADAPGVGGQAPSAVYVSPSSGRASNATGRTS